MAKTSKKAQEKIGKVMEEFKEGKLKSGPGGKGGKVTNRKQAVAIALSEAREEGYKVLPKKATKKTSGKKEAKKGVKKSAKKASKK